MNCPKCGIGRLGGPRYAVITTIYDIKEEVLVRMCQECGWERKDSCADAKPTPAASEGAQENKP